MNYALTRGSRRLWSDWLSKDAAGSGRRRHSRRANWRRRFGRLFEQLEDRVLLHGSADDHPPDSTPAEVNQATVDKGNDQHVRGEILVGFEGDVVEAHRKHGVERAMEVARGLVGRFGLTGGSALFLAPGLAGQAARLVTHWNLPASADVLQVVGQLTGRPGIAYAEPNGIMTTQTHGDPLSPGDPGFTNPTGWPFGVQEHLFSQIHAEEAWDVSFGDTGTVVAVVDTGIDLDHPDLNDNLVPGTTIVKGSTKLGKDDNGHGTHVAGIIAAEINNLAATELAAQANGNTAWRGGTVGVAPKAKIMPVKVLSANGSGSFADVAKGITFAADNFADIINMSLGGGFSQAVSDAINYAHNEKGVLVISSAGNGNAEASGHPAAHLYSLSIAAVDKNDVRASFSNYGFTVDVAAPGVNTLSTFIDLDDTRESGSLTGAYGRISGTSMSSPGAAGVAALIKSLHPSWSPDQVASQLLATADNIDSQNPNFAGKLGGGRVNAAAAVGPEVTAPVVIAVSGIGVAGGTINRLEPGQIISVQYSHVMNATSVLNPANYSLIRDADGDPNSDGNFFNDPGDQVTPLSMLSSSYDAFPGRGVQLKVSETASNAPDGNYQFRVLSGGVEASGGTDLDGDRTGGAGGHFIQTFTLAPRPISNFQPIEPLGSLVYQSRVSDTFNSAADIDRFTVDLDGSPKQVVSVRVNQAPGATVIMTHSVDANVDPDGDGTTIPLSAGTLTIQVTGATAGTYSVDVLLNAVRDGGAAVQSLDGTFVTLASGAKTADRAAVLGSIGASYTPGTMIDDFEDTNKDEYTEQTNGKDRKSNTTVVENAAHIGDAPAPEYGLQDATNFGTGGWLYSKDGALPAAVVPGDTISVWVHSAGGISGRGYFGFGSSSSGTLSMVMAPNTGQLILMRNTNYDYLNLAEVPQSWQANKWYRFVIDWQTDGDIVGRLFDSDGATLLNTVTANDPTVFGSGIAFRSFDSTKYFDTVQKVTPDTTDDVYSFTLGAGDTATLVATRLAGAPTIYVDGSTTPWAGTPITGAGPHTVTVTGDAGTEYSLQVLRNGVFEAEASGNDSSATPQSLTEQIALGAIRPIVVGYYTDFNPGSTRPANPIFEAGYVPRQITNISTFDLSTIDVLTIYEQNNGGISQALLDRLPAIEAWVRAGGRMTVHDRFVSQEGVASDNPLVVGRNDILVMRDFTYDKDIDLIDDTTLVTNGLGPGGDINDTTLDGGNSSSHGFAVTPAGTTIDILRAGPFDTAQERVAGFSYTLDEITPNPATPLGRVYYSTIPLDFYLGGSTPFRTIYAPNTVAYATEGIPQDADWYSVTVTEGQSVTVQTRTPSDDTGQFVNNLNPKLHASSGALEASPTVLPDGRNESVTITTPGTWLIRVTGEASTVGEYILIAAPPATTGGSLASSATTNSAPVVAGTGDGAGALDIRLAVDWLLARDDEFTTSRSRKLVQIGV